MSALPGADSAPAASRSLWQDALRRLRRNRAALVSVAVLTVLIVLVA